MTAAVTVTLCHACRHPARNHGKNGCALGICWCDRTGDELAAPSPEPAPAAAVAVGPPSGRTLDLLDPKCWCGHRRGVHVVNGTAISCQRCACSNFTHPGGADAATAAAPPEPAAATSTTPAPAPAPTRTPQPRRRPARPRLAVTPERPREFAPRPAGVLEDDADEETAADAVASSEVVAVPPAVTTSSPAGVEQLLDLAVWLSARWYCTACHHWPLDGGACATCKQPLRPVYLVTVPREVPGA